MHETIDPRPANRLRHPARHPAGLVGGLVFAAVAGLAGTASAQIACGDVLQRGTTTVLTEDIGPCDGFDYALGVDGAVLDLNGHTFSCADTDGDGAVPDGIVLFGRKAVLRNGTVRGCDDNVFLAGKGKHLVENVTTTQAIEDGLYIQPNSNKSLVTGTVAVANGDDGFELRGNRNRIESSTADSNVEDGIDVAGAAGSLISANVVTGNVDAGIDVDAAGTKVLGNTVTGSGGFGIELSGRRNKIIGNAVSGSGGGIDIAAESCRGNRFADNTVAAPGACVP
jgi:parallel beta-helix repeat protein